MSDHIGEAMESYEMEQFLKDRGLGVLGFAQNGDAYTIPIAFAYDETEPRCILRFIMGEGSKKQAFVSSTETASLSTFEWDGKENWKSVVVNGPIRKLANEEMAEAAALFSTVGEEAALEIFNSPLREYETEWYELQATEVTGRGRFG
jgi:nitroimidazol reductase NimA-like FMN-containing flavoprotein (pyridoxamine 5'-phosphate oxidase superfamily)